MMHSSEVPAGQASRISLGSARRTTAQLDYPVIAETAIPVNVTEQAWIFKLGEEIRVGRTTPRLVNALVKIMKWLNHLGSGKIDDSHLESRYNIPHNFRTNGIRL
jgi:hypothetical protein